MKKPEKKSKKPSFETIEFKQGYNQACDEWEEYYKQELKEWKEMFDASYSDTKYFEKIVNNLPSKEEIERILDKFTYDSKIRDKHSLCWMKDTRIVIAKAISKRIRKK